MEPPAGPPRALRLDPADNVAVALRELAGGDVIALEPGPELAARERIRAGHKLATQPIGCGDAVIKYHEVIGRATREIAPGEHVHTHNVVSARLPGPEGKRP